jgi:large subunit ribosomal protein L6
LLAVGEGIAVSRIGKKPIDIPDGVKVNVDGSQVSVEGPKGKLTQEVVTGITVATKEGKVVVSRADNQRQTRANQGLIRALIANMVRGVHQGFERTLEISGVGYRAELSGKKLVLHLGFSHKREIEIPERVEVKVDKGDRIVVSGIDRQEVGQIAAMVRATRIPDPYKAKGVTYEGERILRKAGKKAVG